MSAPTYPPKKVNNVVNSVFNPADYAVIGNDLKYVKLSGSSMTGALACQGLTTTGTTQFNSNVGLPSAYDTPQNTVAPTTSQLGGTYKTPITTGVAYTASAITNYKSISFNQGMYLIIYRLSLTNISVSALTVSAFAISASTANNVLDEDYRVQNYSTQTLDAGKQTSLSGTFYYELKTGVSKTLYLNYFATASASVNVGGFIQVVRIG